MMNVLKGMTQKKIRISLLALLFLALLLALSVGLESCSNKLGFKTQYVGIIEDEEVLSSYGNFR